VQYREELSLISPNKASTSNRTNVPTGGQQRQLKHQAKEAAWKFDENDSVGIVKIQKALISKDIDRRREAREQIYAVGQVLSTS
jgi:hypothetical protein